MNLITMTMANIRQNFTKMMANTYQNDFSERKWGENKFWPAKLKRQQQLKPAWLRSGLG